MNGSVQGNDPRSLDLSVLLGRVRPDLPLRKRACHAGAMSHEASGQRSAPSRGDHLCVRRRWGYDHHGIYISDSRVIQFGGRICDKVHANIEAVSLERFKDGGRAEVVAHGGKQRWFRWLPWFGAWLPPADPTEKIVRRTEWLREHHPVGRYHLFGWNCEHAANFCVNEYTESLQIRRLFFVHAWTLMVYYVGFRNRRGRPARLRFALAWSSIGPVAIWLYNAGIRRFWRDIGQEWRAYERTISQQGTSTPGSEEAPPERQ
jgi:hypothetical protein